MRAAWKKDYVTDPGVRVQDWGGSLTGVSGSVTVVTDDLDAAMGSARSLKLLYNGSVGPAGRMVLSAALPAAQGPRSIMVRAKAPRSNLNPVSMRVIAYNSGLTANFTWYHTIPNDGEWHTYGCPFSGVSPTSWTHGTTQVDSVHIQEDRTGTRGVPVMATNEYFLVGEVWMNRRARPKVLIFLDDNRRKTVGGVAGAGGYPASGGTFKEILDYYGMRATVTVNPRTIGDQSVAGLEQDTLATLQALQTAGWSIITRSLATPSGNFGKSTHGLRTLGSFGYGPFTVASIDTNTNILTVTAHPFGNGSRVIFNATALPGGITSGTNYYTRNVTNDSITVHPTYADAVANTNIIDITSAGTATTMRWADARPDGTLIRDTVAEDVRAMVALGFTGARHYQTPQGGADQEVQNALSGLGLLSVRGAGVVWPVSWGIGRNGAVPDWFIEPRNLGGAFDIETLGSAATIANINTGVRDCTTMCIYMHSISASLATILDAVCAHLRKLKREGSIDVPTVEEWYSGLDNPAQVIN